MRRTVMTLAAVASVLLLAGNAEAGRRCNGGGRQCGGRFHSHCGKGYQGGCQSHGGYNGGYQGSQTGYYGWQSQEVWQNQINTQPVPTMPAPTMPTPANPNNQNPNNVGTQNNTQTGYAGTTTMYYGQNATQGGCAGGCCPNTVNNNYFFQRGLFNGCRTCR